MIILIDSMEQHPCSFTGIKLDASQMTSKQKQNLRLLARPMVIIHWMALRGAVTLNANHSKIATELSLAGAIVARDLSES